MPSIRADILCVQQGLCESRTTAQRLIEDGQVALPDGTPVHKSSQQLDDAIPLHVLTSPKYVSRGAYKLLGALAAFPHDMADVTALDLGASTGGFTDVLLQAGARRVYAVDVGTDQLHPHLRQDSRVISLEKTHARQLNRTLIPEPIDVLVADVSFISLMKVLPYAAPLLRSDGWITVLIKPQFEAEPRDIGKNGIVKDDVVRQHCVENVIAFCQNNLRWTLLGSLPSPISGGDGNQEYLAVFRAS